MFRKVILAAIGAVTLAGQAPAAQIVGVDAMKEWNLIVLGNLTSSSNVEGRTFVGGSVVGQNSADFNTKGSSQPGHAGLTVVGDVQGNSKNLRGGAIVGGNLTSSFNLNGTAQTVRVGGNAPTQNVNPPNDIERNVAQPGSADYDASFLPNLQAQGLALGSSLLTLSNFLAGLPATPGTASLTDVPNSRAFSALGTGINVINLNGDVFSNASNISFSNTGVTIVNVSGTNLSINDNFNGPANLGEKVIWNFYEATDLAFNRSFYGSVLAPRADATISNFINGSVVVKSLVQNGEVHLGTFNGNLPVPSGVPEPASWAMMIMGFGLVGAQLRRRSGRTAAAA